MDNIQDHLRKNITVIETEQKVTLRPARRKGNKQIRHHRRALDGVLLFDKPKDMTSNQALQRIRHRFNAEKAGHSGTLDPMATGLLPICFGEAAKFSTQLLDADKTYEFTCQLGIQTHTGDAEGDVTAQTPIPFLSTEILESVFELFRGEIMQVPPMVSALWHNGQRLYDLAREGIEIERDARPLTIYSLTLKTFNHDSFCAKVTCSKGTYIRVLAEDIAKKLGTLGHLTALRRTEIYPFRNPIMLSLEEILDEKTPLSLLESHLLKTEIAIMDLPQFILDEALAARFQSGQRVPVGEILEHDMYRIYNHTGEFLGTGYPYMPHVLGVKRMKAVIT